MDFLADKRVGIEANQRSNVQTSTVKDLASHPLLEILSRRLLASINTQERGTAFKL